MSKSKEKFELLFLAGGALLDALGTRLAREPATPEESVGTAMHALGQALDEHAGQLDDPDAARDYMLAIREELCAPKPARLLLAGYINELALQVRPVGELTEAVEHLRHQVNGYLRGRLSPWSLR
jgi:hypothetical protein